MKIYLKSFVAGFLATLFFHQGIIAIFYFLGIIPIRPFNLNPVGFLGVPSVVSLAFFGGLWGILLWKLIYQDTAKKFWYKSLIYGAIGPTAVAFLVVFPLKGVKVVPIMIVFGLILNAGWGLGTALIMRMLKKV